MMPSFNLIKRTFVRQSGQDDCGIACLAMILNYAGKSLEVPALRSQPVPAGGVSLLDLRALAQRYGLTSRCVEMELSFLYSLTFPCILHTVTPHGEHHFQVCYGAVNRTDRDPFLMADPARQVYRTGAEQLARQWQSRAALYFDPVPARLEAFRHPVWFALWNLRTYPAGLLAAVPVLSLCGAAFGVSLSWLLQMGLNDTLLLQGHLVRVLLCLLFLISLFRSVVAGVRQWILVRVSISLVFRLTRRLLNRLFHPAAPDDHSLNALTVRNSFADIHRVEEATLSFMTGVLADGALILTMLSAVFFELPAAGLINLFFAVVALWLTLRYLPRRLYAHAEVNHLADAAERLVLRDVERLPVLRAAGLLETRKSLHTDYYCLHLRQVQSTAVGAGRLTLLMEVLAAVNVLAVFGWCLQELNNGSLSYGNVMVIVLFSYLSSSLMPKVCGSLVVVAEGAQAAVQLRASLHDDS